MIAALGWLGWTWLRDSSLVQVDEVQVTGLTTRDAPAIRRTLRQAAMRMTTLHYSEAELKRAVEPFPAVQSVSVDADLPHKLRDQRARAPARGRAGVRRRAPRGGRERRHAAARSERDVRLPAVKVDAIPGGGRLGQGRRGRPRASASRAPRRSCARSWTAPTGPGDGVRVAMRRRPHAALRRPDQAGREMGRGGARAGRHRRPRGAACSTCAYPSVPRRRTTASRDARQRDGRRAAGSRDRRRPPPGRRDRAPTGAAGAAPAVP